MSRKLTDEQIDRMLNNYFCREPETAFSVKTASEKRSEIIMRKTIITAAAVCVFTLLIGSGVYTYSAVHSEPNAVSGQINTETCLLADNSLFLKAYAENILPADTPDISEMSSQPEVEIIDSGFCDEDFFENRSIGYRCPDREAIDSGKAAANMMYPTMPNFGIAFMISGENIVSYTLESENNGQLYYMSPNNIPNPDKEYNPYPMQLPAEGAIPYVSRTYNYWKIPDHTIYDESLAIANDFYGGEDTSRISEKAQNKIIGDLLSMTPEELTASYGDTVTVTAVFEDGTTETITMVISINEDYDFVINYR